MGELADHRSGQITTGVVVCEKIVFHNAPDPDAPQWFVWAVTEDGREAYTTVQESELLKLRDFYAAYPTYHRACQELVDYLCPGEKVRRYRPWAVCELPCAPRVPHDRKSHFDRGDPLLPPNAVRVSPKNPAISSDIAIVPDSFWESYSGTPTDPFFHGADPSWGIGAVGDKRVRDGIEYIWGDRRGGVWLPVHCVEEKS